MAETEQQKHTPHAPDAAHAASRTALQRISRARISAALSLLAIVALCTASATVFAQQKFTKVYRTPRRNIRLQLTNRSGTIEIEGWDRNEIKVTAEMESSAARFTPIVDDEGLVIDVMSDTRGREGVGDVNFKVQVPADATVDLETRIGNISVRNVHGSMVRAVVTSSGDIDLTGLRAFKVMASNITGNILFDAELLSGGLYDLKSTQGNISVRISGGSGFTLTATAPRTRNIDLGNLANRGDFSFQGDNRRVVGRVGDGSATLTPTTLRGTINFFTR
ncbi:MAG: hypothetical protein QOF61_1193 [Acidobacteriota bacterium]|jgi:DUF4097 and DUF4098 domain-containing protein YvlB|nr:hypothetical protein [Acidobacteriota bacterium]